MTYVTHSILDGVYTVRTTDEEVVKAAHRDPVMLSELLARLAFEFHTRGDVPVLHDTRDSLQCPFWVEEDDGCPAHLAL